MELNMMTVGIAIAVIVIIALVVLVMGKGEGGFELAKPIIELHPTQVKFVEGKEKQYCDGSTKGKGVRCIIDYLREAEKEHVTEVLSEKPKYSEGFVTWQMTHLHDRQLDFLATKGVRVGSGEGAEKFADVSKAVRAMVDYTMRMESEGNEDKIKDIYEEIRCLNC